MNAFSRFHSSLQGIVADVGRNTVRLGLTDEDGKLDHGSVREYDPSAQSTISTAISAFAQESGLRSLPSRAAIAVSGVPRGDTISITKSRWILSRTGLTAMFRAPPLIINDFAANAWAMSDPHCSGRIEPMTAAPVRPGQAGTYCIIGLGSGLGVAIMSRDEHGLVNVLPTEGGHLGLMHGVKGAERIMNAVAVGDVPVASETLFAGQGLLSTYRAVCKLQGRAPAFNTLSELLAGASLRNDPAAAEAFEFVGRGFWHFAGNMALAYGAWDGVILTGSITAALKPVLRRPDLACAFHVQGPYTRQLASTPRAMISFKHAELEGAAVALLMQERRKQAAEQLRMPAHAA
jgi:glucokinase